MSLSKWKPLGNGIFDIYIPYEETECITSTNERLIILSQYLAKRDINIGPCVYFFNIEGIHEYSSVLYKIGWTKNVPKKEKQLRCGNPFGFIDFLFYPGDLELESCLHNFFRKEQVGIKGMREIFCLDLSDIEKMNNSLSFLPACYTVRPPNISFR